MPTGVESVFVDTNILVFANVSEAPMHKVALATLKKFAEAGAAMWISGQVIREFLVVRSRDDMFKKAFQMDILLERIKFFQSTFHVAYDTQETMKKLEMLLKKIDMAGKQIHDANIVATMLTNNITHLLTDNRDDFDRFSSHITVVPLREY